MSIQAIRWALEQQLTRDIATRAVLIALAERAGVTGDGAFPSNAFLQAATGLSERGVRQQLRNLEQLGLIRRGNQALAACHIKRADRRPVVYDLAMPRGAAFAPRYNSTGGQAVPLVSPNGGHQTTERGAPGAPDPDHEPEPKNARASAGHSPRTATEDFVADFTRRFRSAPK